MRKESGAMQRETRNPRFYREKASNKIRMNDNIEARIELQELNILRNNVRESVKPKEVEAKKYLVRMT